MLILRVQFWRTTTYVCTYLLQRWSIGWKSLRKIIRIANRCLILNFMRTALLFLLRQSMSKDIWKRSTRRQRFNRSVWQERRWISSILFSIKYRRRELFSLNHLPGEGRKNMKIIWKAWILKKVKKNFCWWRKSRRETKTIF